MDDLLTGAQTLEKVKRLINELVQVTHKGGMNLRQWASNGPDLTNSFSEEVNGSRMCLNLGDTTKTLGVYWNPKSDSLMHTVNQTKIEEPVTKRTILSQIAQLFDPLGLLGPVILKAKRIMQSLWLLELGRNESVPQHVHTAWLDYQNHLPLLQEYNINRKILIDDYRSFQIPGFCDASKKAYGELCAALLISHLLKTVSH